MKSSRSTPLWKPALVVVACFLFFLYSSADSAPGAGKKKRGIVWVVLFFSEDCPHCERVRDLLKALDGRYSVRLKMFNIDNETDYAVYSRLEKLHPVEKLAVPLIMVGDKILIGENQIVAALEETVRRLDVSGGSAIPNLGNGRSQKRGEKPSCTDCDSNDHRKSREPGRMKIIEDGF